MQSPSYFAWAAKEAPHYSISEFISSHKANWPQWDWRGMIDAGIQARHRNEDVDEAIERCRQQLGLPSNNQILVTAWLSAGLILKIHQE